MIFFSYLTDFSYCQLQKNSRKTAEKLLDTGRRGQKGTI
jgi:hypothetical protein